MCSPEVVVGTAWAVVLSAVARVHGDTVPVVARDGCAGASKSAAVSTLVSREAVSDEVWSSKERGTRTYGDR